MTQAELIQFLKRQKYGVVSSSASDGQPQSAVVGIATRDNGDIVFDTLGTSRKARNLRRDRRLALAVWDGERTVQLEGIADEPRGSERERVVEAYLAAFPDGRERLSWPDITHFRIRPKWAKYSDFSAQPEPSVEELRFDS